MLHRTVVVHDGLTYIVVLSFEMRDGKIAVAVHEVIRVASFNLELRAAS